jgi:hypothetical protein
VNCSHDGYRSIITSYDRPGGVLIYFWACEQCGAILDEAGRQKYQPRFIPLPNQHQRVTAPTLTR